MPFHHPEEYSAIFSPFHGRFGPGSHLFHSEFWPITSLLKEGTSKSLTWPHQPQGLPLLDLQTTDSTDPTSLSDSELAAISLPSAAVLRQKPSGKTPGLCFVRGREPQPHFSLQRHARSQRKRQRMASLEAREVPGTLATWELPPPHPAGTLARGQNMVSAPTHSRAWGRGSQFCSSTRLKAEGWASRLEGQERGRRGRRG